MDSPMAPLVISLMNNQTAPKLLPVLWQNTSFWGKTKPTRAINSKKSCSPEIWTFPRASTSICAVLSSSPAAVSAHRTSRACSLLFQSCCAGCSEPAYSCCANSSSSPHTPLHFQSNHGNIAYVSHKPCVRFQIPDPTSQEAYHLKPSYLTCQTVIPFEPDYVSSNLLN